MLRKGFTLIEILIAIGVLAITVGGSLIALNRGQVETALAGNAEGGAKLFGLVADKLAAGNPRFAPNQESQEKSWGYGALAELYSQLGGTDLSNPQTYRLKITRLQDIHGSNDIQMARYQVETCWKAPIAQGEQCFYRTVIGAIPSKIDTLQTPTGGSGNATLPSSGGTIELTIDDGGAGTVNVRLSGPNFSKTFSAAGSYTLTNLPGGSYSATAQPVSDGHYAYQANISQTSSNLIAGGGAAINVIYTTITGALEVRITAPDGTGPQVRVTGPNGYDQTLSGAGVHLLPYLEPGVYTIETKDYTNNGYIYVGQSSDNNVQVSVGQTPVVAVAYGPGTGSMVIDSTNVPTGVQPGFSIAGPASYNNHVNGQNIKLDYLEPGNYSIVADPLTVNGYSYGATLSPQNPVVQAGQITNVSAAFEPITGKLDLVIAAPANTTPNVNLTGPNGFSGQYHATQSLIDLDPGTYTATADSLLIDGFTYKPEYTGNPATVQKGQQSRIDVTWAASDGKMRVNVTGVPSGSSPKIDITGASYSNTITKSTTLSGLNPGTYNVVPNDFRHNYYTYAGVASPSSPTISAGNTTNVNVQYQPVTGAMAIDLTPPPGGATPALHITDGNGYNQTLHAGGLLEDLSPGTYTLSADPIDLNGIIYEATFTPGNQVNINPGNLTNVTAQYRPTNALLTIQISPAPDGNADIAVTGPNGTQHISNTTTLQLPPGDYTLTAAPVTIGRDIYKPTPDQLSIHLNAGDSSQTAFTYTVWSGSLDLSITGLPTGNNASVTISGPNGYQKTVSASTVLYSLAPGDYTINANPVAVGAQRFEASPASGTARIKSNQTTTYTIRYSQATATLRVAATGLPSGTTASLDIRGPGGYSNAVAAPPTAVLAGVEPGTYHIYGPANPISAGSYDYVPETRPVDISLAPADDKTATVKFVPNTGAIQVTVTAPSGVKPDITLSGPRFSSPVTISQTQRFDHLPVGAYTLTTKPVTANGHTYNPTPSGSDTFTLAGGTTVQRSVTYQQYTGTITIVVDAPSGLPLDVTLSGQGVTKHYTQPGTYSVPGLNPGNYTISARPVSQNGFDYAPSVSPATVTLTKGGRQTSTVTYSATNALLNLTISGPSGLPANVQLTYPDGSHTSYTQPGSYAVPLTQTGTYTLQSSNVVYNGYTYAPTPQNTSFAVSYGSTINKTVQYAPVNGSLAVSIRGVPSGANASVVVSGPNGYSKTLAASTTLTGLQPGTYTITAHNITANGFIYVPDKTTQSVPVQTGSVARSSVTFTPVDGKLTITVSGAPSGSSPNITITGPNGYRTVVHRTTTLTHLTPGTYTVRAANITYNGYTYTPSPARISATVTAGNNTTKSVTYNAADGKLTITVSGAPSGSSPNITITGPNGYRTVVHRTTTLTHLTPGTYTISAASMTYNFTRYLPNPPYIQTAVSAGSNTAKTVRYVSGTQYGTLIVKIDRNFASIKGPSFNVKVYGNRNSTFITRTYTVRTGTYSATASIVGPWYTNSQKTIRRRWNPVISGSPAYIGLRATKTITIDYKLEESRKYCDRRFFYFLWCTHWAWKPWTRIGD